MDSGTLSAALRYASAGVAVLPTHWPLASGCCSCGCNHPQCWERAKHPLVSPASATTDHLLIRQWWDRWPAANVGIAPVGVIIVDLDPQPSAPDPLLGFAERWGIRLEDAVSCRTGSGGWHFFFERPLASKPGWTGKDRLGSGGDVLAGRGAYVVAPPSIHHTLGRYAWVGSKMLGEGPLPPLPSLIERELERRLPIRWMIRVAPYSIVAKLGLQVEARQRLRRVLRVPRA